MSTKTKRRICIFVIAIVFTLGLSTTAFAINTYGPHSPVTPYGTLVGGGNFSVPNQTNTVESLTHYYDSDATGNENDINRVYFMGNINGGGANATATIYVNGFVYNVPVDGNYYLVSYGTISNVGTGLNVIAYVNGQSGQTYNLVFQFRR